MRVEDLRRFAHEVHAAYDDHVGIDAARLACELQRVADDIRDPVEDLRRLVVMSEDHGMPLAFQAVDGVDIGREKIPLGGGNDVGDAVVERARAVGDGGGERKQVEHRVGFRELVATLILILRKRG
jgi:hypothetical protein